MRVRITKSPTEETIDGMRLHHFWVGRCYEVSSHLAAVLLAEGWAELAEPECPAEDAPGMTGDLVGDMSRRYARPIRKERRIAAFPIDETAAFARSWRDRRRRKPTSS